jgi:hypothetical protein
MGAPPWSLARAPRTAIASDLKAIVSSSSVPAKSRHRPRASHDEVAAHVARSGRRLPAGSHSCNPSARRPSRGRGGPERGGTEPGRQPSYACAANFSRRGPRPGMGFRHRAIISGIAMLITPDRWNRSARAGSHDRRPRGHGPGGRSGEVASTPGIESVPRNQERCFTMSIKFWLRSSFAMASLGLLLLAGCSDPNPAAVVRRGAGGTGATGGGAGGTDTGGMGGTTGCGMSSDTTGGAGATGGATGGGATGTDAGGAGAGAGGTVPAGPAVPAAGGGAGGTSGGAGRHERWRRWHERWRRWHERRPRSAAVRSPPDALTRSVRTGPPAGALRSGVLCHFQPARLTVPGLETVVRSSTPRAGLGWRGRAAEGPRGHRPPPRDPGGDSGRERIEVAPIRTVRQHPAA